MNQLTKSEKEKIRDAFDNVEVDMIREGTKIILPSDPADMSIDAGIKTLQRLKKQEETEVAVHEEINCFPLEGAYFFMLALKEIYGWLNPQPTPGFFGDTPPTMVGLEYAPGQYTQVVWGQMAIPGVEGHLETGATLNNGMPRFVVKGIVKQKFLKQVKEIAALTRRIAMENSIYKGKAIRLSASPEGKINFKEDIKFLDLSRVNPDELVHPDITMEQVQVNIFTPIEKTQMCRDHKIPLSRKVLLEGPYGTGKTITAYVAATKAVANGWTFVYLDRVAGIKDALLFAKQYAPAVLFSEDIDRITDGKRDVGTDDILNTVDGVDMKGVEILTILTTNEVSKIHPGMIRPGRLDAVISVRAPDAKAAQKLVRVYARDLLDENTELTGAGKALEGNIPATIREVVERSKLYAIGRSAPGQKIRISDEDLVRSANGMKMHLDLLNKKGEEKSPAERFMDTLKENLELSSNDVFRRKSGQKTARIEKIGPKVGVDTASIQ